MKKQFFQIIPIVLLTFLGVDSSAQRFISEIFTEVNVIENIVYGENATVLFQLATGGDATPEELMCDVYEPANDNLEKRPLVLVFHSGTFLPPVVNNQIIGSRKDSSVVEICNQLARRGFVAAAASYRLGWNPVAPSQPTRATSYIRALYRGIQDGRTAIRYFKKTEAEENNPFGIDESKIASLGIGTGGSIVLGMLGLDDYGELLNTTNPEAKFLLDLDQDGIPETPMVDTLYAGDVEGKRLAIAPETAQGFLQGDTLNYPNHVNYSSEFQVGINIGGTIGDISWLEDQTAPCIAIHSVDDPINPYNDFPLIFAILDPIINVQGSQKVGELQELNGINQKWKDFGFSDPITQLAITNSDKAEHNYYEGLLPYVQDPNSLGLDEGVAIDWWDPNAASPNQGMGTPWNMLQHPSGVSFHEAGLTLNENMSAEKARANIDTVMQFMIPRMMLQLELEIVLDTEDTLEEKLSLKFTPNPAHNYVVMESSGAPIEAIQIFDNSGRLILAHNDIHDKRHVIESIQVQLGVYIIKAQIGEQVVFKKMVFL